MAADANLSALALTTSITNGQDLLLYRTLDLPEDPEQRLEEVQRGIAVAAAYFEDKLGDAAPVLYYAGIGAGGTAPRKTLPAGSDDPELTVVDLAPQAGNRSHYCHFGNIAFWPAWPARWRE